MAEAGKGIGKLGFAILESLVESKLGEQYNRGHPAPTEEQVALSQAMQRTADRLWQEWADKRKWDALFNHLPARKKLLTDLKPAVKKFYQQPSDTGFPTVLTKVLLSYNDFPPETIQKAVEEYITTLTAELIIADKIFCENAGIQPDSRLVESQNLADGESLIPQPSESLLGEEIMIPPMLKKDETLPGRSRSKSRKSRDIVTSPAPEQDESLPAQPLIESLKDDDLIPPLMVEKTEIVPGLAVSASQDADEVVSSPMEEKVNEQDDHSGQLELADVEIPEPTDLPIGSRFPGIRLNPHFMGKGKELNQLAVLLEEKNPVAIGQAASATGTGGIGKTTLASEFARRYGSMFPGGVFWLSFAHPGLIPFEVAACGDVDDNAPLETQVSKVRAEWQSETRRLLIFDNCEDPRLLAQWLPGEGGSRILVTSQQNNWDADQAVKPILLELFKRPESIAMLRGYRDDLAAEDPNLGAIAGMLGDLPLALHLAGSFLSTYRLEVSPGDYLSALRKPVPRKPGASKEREFSPIGHDLKVRRIVAIDIEWLSHERGTNRLALDLLKQIACYAPGKLIPRELLWASAGVKKTDTALFGYGVNRLLEMGLVEQDMAGDLRMHKMVAFFIQDLLPGKDALEQVENAVLAAAARANQGGRPARMRPILAHLKYLTDQALKDRNELATSLANELGYYLEAIKDYPNARYYYTEALILNQKVRGEGHPDTTVCLTNLGGLLEVMGDYEAARPYYERALVIRRKVLGMRHPDTARSLNNLGHLLHMMGNYAEARPNYEQALAIRRGVLGEEHPDTVVSLSNLGGLLQTLGDNAAARPLFKQALAVNRKLLGEEHLDTANSLANMGGVLQAMGDHAGARPHFEQALAIRRNLLGEEHLDTAASLNSLGEVLKAMDDYKGARPYLEQSLAIRTKTLGDKHPATITSLTNVGELLQAMGDYSGARAFFERALAIDRKTKDDEQRDAIAGAKIQKYSLRAKLALAVLFVFSVAVIGWQVFARRDVNPTIVDGIQAAPSEMVLPTSEFFPGLLVAPTRVPTRVRTATFTRTPTATATKYVPRPTLTPFRTATKSGNVAPNQPTKTKVPTKTSIIRPTNTSVAPTNTFVVPTKNPTSTTRPTSTSAPFITDTPVPPTAEPSNTPVVVPTPAPTPENNP